MILLVNPRDDQAGVQSDGGAAIRRFSGTRQKVWRHDLRSGGLPGGGARSVPLETGPDEPTFEHLGTAFWYSQSGDQ